MSGFEFLSVVRRRFPAIPVIVISGAFTGLSIPESVLADAFFPKAGYQPGELLARMIELIRASRASEKLPSQTRPTFG